MNIEEFCQGEDDQYSVLGSCAVKSGSTIAVCGITGGIVEKQESLDFFSEEILKEMKENEKSSGSESEFEKNDTCYPVVSISRGRSGAPTDEEMILSQKLYETLWHSGILRTLDLDIKLGMRTEDGGIFYPDDTEFEDIKPKKKYRFVLYANIQVFSRSGPLFDLCWASLLSALSRTFLPQILIDEKSSDVRLPLRSRPGAKTAVQQDYQLVCDRELKTKLKLDDSKIGWSSTFGVVPFNNEPIVLADLEGEAEESASGSRLNVVYGADKLKSVSIMGEGVTRESIKECLAVARERRMAELS